MKPKYSSAYSRLMPNYLTAGFFQLGSTIEGFDQTNLIYVTAL